MGLLDKLFGKSAGQNNSYETDKRFQIGEVPNFESMREFGQISSMFEWVFNPNDSVANDAALAIDRILRDRISWKNNVLYTSLKYINLKKSDIAEFDKFEPEIKESLLCVASLNGNGFVREEALLRLVKNKTNFSFPFILFRLADWVSVIHARAEAIVREMIALTDIDFLIKHHKIIDWLLTVQRNDLKDLHTQITNGIFSPNNVAQLLSKIDTYSEGDRFYVYKNLINRNLLTQGNLESVLSDKNYLIRLFAAKAFELSENPNIIKKLLTDKSQNIRHYALKKIEDQISFFKPELIHLILDDSGLIRAMSRNLLSKVQKIGFYQFYIDSFDQKPSVGNIIGISEVGTKNDIVRLKEVLNSEKAKLRASVLFAISNLDFSQAKEICFNYLLDSSNKVKETCASIIPKTVLPNDLMKLREIYNSGDSDTKRFVLRIIKSYGGWSIAGDFLKGLSESDQRLQDLSYILLSSWYGYSIRLGTEKRPEDIEYVMEIYRTLNFEELSYGATQIVKRIPFIFKN